MEVAYSGVLAAILAVFSAIGDWIVTAVDSFVPMFFAEGQLTLIGTLSVASLAFAVCFLIVGIIQSFLRFR